MHPKTSPSRTFTATNIFRRPRTGVELIAALEASSGVPGDQAEAAGIAAHEAAEHRATRKQEAAQTAAQARRWKAREAAERLGAARPADRRGSRPAPLRPRPSLACWSGAHAPPAGDGKHGWPRSKSSGVCT